MQSASVGILESHLSRQYKTSSSSTEYVPLSIDVRIDLVDVPLDLLEAAEEDGVDNATPEHANAEAAVGTHAHEADRGALGFAGAGGEEGFLIDCLGDVDGVDLRIVCQLEAQSLV